MRNTSDKVLVAMSGGVDSSAAAVVMQKAGYNIGGGTMHLCGGNNEAQDAKTVCEQLKIPHYMFEETEQFNKNVIEPFIDSYKKGLTPNPCIFCNRTMKFGEFIDKAVELGFDAIVTGHYARIEYNKASGRYILKKAKDTAKDQSYVLYMLTQAQLRRLYLPLGDYTKQEIRNICSEAGLVTAKKKDSQDICFVPDGDYAGFIERYTGEKLPKGLYVDTDGKILGENKGVVSYTIGQRKGLGIALGKHMYVLSKDAATDTVVLGDEQELFKTTVYVEQVNLISVEKIAAPTLVSVKLRYRHNQSPAVLYPCEDGKIRIEFESPQRAPSPGQAAVFYDGDTVIGGGVICG